MYQQHDVYMVMFMCRNHARFKRNITTHIRMHNGSNETCELLSRAMHLVDRLIEL